MAPERLGQRPERRAPGESLAALASLGIPGLATRGTSVREPGTRNHVAQAVRPVAPGILAADVQHSYFPAALHLARHMGQHPQVARPAGLATLRFSSSERKGLVSGKDWAARPGPG